MRSHVRRAWIKHVANTGSIPNAQCSNDAIQRICFSLSTAFCPSDELRIISSGNNESNKHVDGNNHKPDDRAEDDVEMMDDLIQEVGEVNRENGGARTQDAEMQDFDEQPASNSNQSNGEKIDKSSIIITESTKTVEGIPNVSVADSAAQIVATMTKPNHPVAFNIVRPAFYLTPLKPAFTPIRALYLDLLYQDRFILLSNSDFLLFLAEKPQLSHAFLRHLIHHPFGIRYTHRDGDNANHGITPFDDPFLPVDLSLPSHLFFENRWALLNDPAWLWRVSMEEFIMASFWAEMSFRGGLGVMKRRREVTERASDFAMAPF